jgi:cytochrome oxidase Cu insertion factor (SCO1/SenC/PrrC family)
MNFMRGLFLLLLISLSTSVRASSVVPADSNAGQVPNVTVWDESNHQDMLWNKIQAAGMGPVIVLPVYTRCTMSCPVLAHMLVQQTSQLNGGGPYRVVIFSFDPSDDATALRQFREQKNIPASWLLLRSNASGVRRFCDFFHYSVLTEGPVMIHTNQIFLLNHDLRWRASFIDERWSVTDLQIWLKRVETPGILGWLAMNPQMLMLAGFGFMLLSISIIFVVLLKRPRREAALPANIR